MDYRARFYSPYLNRFIQPDSLIPNPSNPQAFNRFSYVLNQPTRYTDPSGYCPGLKPGKKCPANPKITGPVKPNPPTTTPISSFTSGGSNNNPITINLPADLEPTLMLPSTNNSPFSYWKMMFGEVDPGSFEAYWSFCTANAINGVFPEECISDYKPKPVLLLWDTSRINGRDLAFDSASLVASFVALNWATQTAKFASGSTNTLSSFNSVQQEDWLGVYISIHAYLPGPPGIYASIVAVGRDISAGFYEVEVREYGPPPPGPIYGPPPP
jgi:hypothetical protein